jgi:hypothetical protein
MGVCAPRVAPARARTRSCPRCPRAARPLPVAGLPLCPSLLQGAADVTYKEARASPRVRRARPVHPPIRHGPLWPPPPDTFRCPPPKPPHHPDTSSSPYRSSLLALSRRRGSTSPEASLRRRTPPGAAEGHRRQHLRPDQIPKLGIGDPWTALRPRPAGPGRRFAGIWPDHCRPVPKGHIARNKTFLRGNLQTKGFSVRDQNR